MVRKHQTSDAQLRIGNLEIPGSRFARPGMTLRVHFFTLLASILIAGSSILVLNAVPTSNGFSMPR